MTNKSKITKTLITIFLLWALGLILFLSAIFIKEPQNLDQKTDAIVVLTGGENRIETGLELFAHQSAPELFISGVYPSVTKADIVKKWNGKPDLPVCCVTLGYDSTTTTQNAEETARWIKDKNIKTIRLVTSNFHMSRAVMDFRNHMPELKIITHPVIQPNAKYSDLWFWIVSVEEYHKTLVRMLGFVLTPPQTAHAHNKNHNEHNQHEG